MRQPVAALGDGSCVVLRYNEQPDDGDACVFTVIERFTGRSVEIT